MSVDVKEQVSLPLSKCLELVLSGIKFRLFRAGITVTIIALAVAFLLVMLTESYVARRVADVIDNKTAPRRLCDKWVSRLSTPLTETELTAELLALGGADDPRYRELKAWGRLDDAAMDRLQKVAQTQREYMVEYFDQLKEGAKRRLVGTAQGPAIFARLTDPVQYAEFMDEAKKGDRVLPGKDKEAEFRAFMNDWSDTRPAREAVLTGHAQALAAVRQHLDDEAKKSERATTPIDKLADPDTAFLSVLAANLFQMDDGQKTTVQAEARQKAAEAQLRSALNVPIVKRQLADRKSVKPADTDFQMLFVEVSKSGGAKWLAELSAAAEYAKDAASQNLPLLNLTDKELPTAPNQPKRSEFPDGSEGDKAFTQANDAYKKELPPFEKKMEPFAEAIQKVARQFLVAQALAETEQQVVQAGAGGDVGFTGRTLWLIIVSFLVCVVGIANAMLMSVTERFREIATMKCLGATDGFIMINFIMESVMQGVAGSVVGALLGLILGVLRAWASYGGLAWANFPVLDVLESMGIGLVVGVVVSALAATYPAYVAARLAPMEAMRIE